MNTALIFAGGVGRRMHSKEKPKQFLELYNKPIIIHTLEHFEKHPLIDNIVVVCVEGWIDYLEILTEQYNIKKVSKIVPGGTTGQMSIYNGLCAIEEISNNKDDIVLIHDGVRPIINEKLITDNIESVRRNGSAITTAVVKETILVVNENSSTIDYVPERKNSRVAKAPQSFYLKDIIRAHRKCLEDGETNCIDSCTMMQKYGFPLHLIDGPDDNIKITTPEDFYIIRALMDAKENAQIYEYEEG